MTRPVATKNLSNWRLPCCRCLNPGSRRQGLPKDIEPADEAVLAELKDRLLRMGKGESFGAVSAAWGGVEASGEAP